MRAATIRTGQGRTNRPIAKLILLEVSSEVSPIDLDTSSSGPSSRASSNAPVKEVEGMDRPRRAAAQRGRAKAMNRTKQLGGAPEDVTD